MTFATIYTRWINSAGLGLQPQGGPPRGIRTGCWEVDRSVGSSWGYTTTERIHFTVKQDALYAIVLNGGPSADLALASLSTDQASLGKVATVSLLGSQEPVRFTQDQNGLSVKRPNSAPVGSPFTLKITGLKMNPPTATASGNPLPEAMAL